MGYSRSSAERAALKKCDADDARIVCWVNNGFCALAVSEDGSGWGTGWSYGDGATNRYAEYAVDRPVKFQEVFSTLYRNVGLDGRKVRVFDKTGVPRYLVDDGIYPAKAIHSSGYDPFQIIRLCYITLQSDSLKFIGESPNSLGT